MLASISQRVVLSAARPSAAESVCLLTAQGATAYDGHIPLLVRLPCSATLQGR